ncbi:esterase/lipase family protein [Sporanaerobacter acetigenes]|uniref:esterase/lipase family protein n=1 Tax=Sporanaerobacter acetigenes TaxID=165813 RepID=UPI001043E938|nr:alpha/beta fold hydrolase [Sporanaerobacter acetigenes]
MDYPIVFIPGLFGSLGDDVIKGTGEFSFGFAEKAYRPFIEILNAMGYREGSNLFISYYDWKKPVLEAVDKYLFLDIEKIKEKTKKDKVILIGHSLGGLLGRAYMNYFNPFSVDKLIMIGTPNLGTVNAYYFWSGGKLPYSKIENNVFYNALKIGFMLYYYLFKSINHIQALRKMFPVVRDLLPSYGYGNYLFYEKNGMRKDIPIKNMSVNNVFLNRLEEENIKKDKLFIVSGGGVYTNKEFLIDENNKDKAKWEDGKPIRVYKTNCGDGTVTTFSTLGNLGGESVVLEGNHTDILYESKDFLSAILEKSLVKVVGKEKVEKVYIIFMKNCDRLSIKTSETSEISSQSMNIADDRIQAINLANNIFWIMIIGDRNLEIELDYDKHKGTEVLCFPLAMGKDWRNTYVKS